MTVSLFQESNKLHKYLRVHGPGYRLDLSESTPEEHYSSQNSVDYSVEREYEVRSTPGKGYVTNAISAILTQKNYLEVLWFKILACQY